MIRAGVSVLAVLALPASASAAQFEVGASGTSFSPSSVTITQGDTVNFSNQGGQHNVKFEDGQFEQPPEPSTDSWRVSRTFQAVGHFNYFCEQHQTFGMTGVVHVNAPGSGGGGGGGGGGGQGQTPAKPFVEALKLRRARGGGITVRLRASVASTATITLSRRVRRRFRKVLSARRKVGEKAKNVTSRRDRRGRRLAPGRYRATVQLTKDGIKGPRSSRPITLR